MYMLNLDLISRHSIIVAEESMSNVRTVRAFANEHLEDKR
jgi:hypothetical protein